MALLYPDIGPVAFTVPVLGLPIRWYALAYLTGFLAGWRYMLYLARRTPDQRPDRLDIDDFLTWAMFGVILGGRIGYVLFYQPEFYLAHPLHVFMVWQGGMSFHGGATGTIVAMLIYSWRSARTATIAQWTQSRHGAAVPVYFQKISKIPLLRLTDWVCCAVPIGLFFGRLANFANDELFGRITTSPLGMIFPRGGPLPRYPSQLFEAGLEGLLLFTVLCLLAHNRKICARPGILSGVFLIGYALCRIIVEFFRQPDPQLGFILGPFTMGQILSVPMIFGGLAVIFWAMKHDRLPQKP